MAKNAKYKGQLYQHTVQTLNAVLRLEYAIRATKSFTPKFYNQLIEINKEITNYWYEKGYKNEEIKYDHLLDYSWDFLQASYTGGITSPNTIITEELFEDFQESWIDLEKLFKSRVNDLNSTKKLLPRYADLANGNDLVELLEHYLKVRKYIDKYEGSEEENNAACYIADCRKPRYITPHTKVGTSLDNGKPAIFNMLQLNSPIGSLKSAMLEFLHVYMLLERQTMGQEDKKAIPSHPEKDTLIDEASSLYNLILQEEFKENSYTLIKRHDSFLGAMIGLIAWDIKQSTTIEEMIEIIKKKLNDVDKNFDEIIRKTLPDKDKLASSEESIKNYYKGANRRISKLKAQLTN